jgi:hypothetical protein
MEEASVIAVVIPHAVLRTTRLHQLDDSPNLASKNGTLRHGTDGRGVDF